PQRYDREPVIPYCLAGLRGCTADARFRLEDGAKAKSRVQFVSLGAISVAPESASLLGGRARQFQWASRLTLDGLNPRVTRRHGIRLFAEKTVGR
ncbi:MAG: hypothetical protein ABI665_18320, partial [Vicinamibacterales bacterium]